MPGLPDRPRIRAPIGFPGEHAVVLLNARAALQEPEVDTLIFLLVLATLLSMRAQRRWLTLILFFTALTAALLLFNFHVSDPLPLNF